MTFPNGKFRADMPAMVVWVAAFLFFGLTTWCSYARWANFEYRTFDLAFYAQGLWQFLHGRFQVSILRVPILGNHVEPIVFLFAPLIALVPHPIMLVVAQNAALAIMAPVSFSIGATLSLSRWPSALLAVALLLTPVTAYVALHEFHPEALSAPLLLLVIRSYLRRSWPAYYLWLTALLLCKENIALLILAFCLVGLCADRKLPARDLLRWHIAPGVIAAAWLVLCTKLIAPALNHNAIDYAALYSHLGTSATDILLHPGRIPHALGNSIVHGNFLWALLLPFLALPVIGLRWSVIAVPLLLQHLLSWRSSEWTIYFHYAAPIVALFWVATVAVLARRNAKLQIIGAVAIAIACLIFQIFLGPGSDMSVSFRNWSAQRADRVRKNELLASIPATASVVAPLPYLSHLAFRESLYSLHLILKGLNTLGHTRYQPPPPTDVVLIDYADSATFDPSAGYYHPQMRTRDGQIIPSSDQLLRSFLVQANWHSVNRNELSLLQQTSSPPTILSHADSPPIGQVATGSTIASIVASPNQFSPSHPLTLTVMWNLAEDRHVIPWMSLRLTNIATHQEYSIVHGLCAPQARAGAYIPDEWQVFRPPSIPPGLYSAELVFVDHTRESWPNSHPGFLSPPVSLEQVRAE